MRTSARPAQREQRRMGAVPPAVAADDRQWVECPPVETAPEAGRPRDRVGLDGGTSGFGESRQPAVQLRGGRAPVAHPAGRLAVSGPGPLRAASAPAHRRGARMAARPNARRAVRAVHAKGTSDSSSEPSWRRATLTSCSVIRKGPVPARRTARSASIDFASVSAACQHDGSTLVGGASSMAVRSSMQGLAVGEPGGDVRGHRPQVVLSDVLDAVATRSRLQERDAEGGSSRSQRLQQRQEVQ